MLVETIPAKTEQKSSDYVMLSLGPTPSRH